MKKTIHCALALAAIALFSCQKQSLTASENEATASLEKTEAVDLNRGLMAYFPFNGNGNDESGNKFKAKLMNGATFGTDKDGNANSCLQLDGINDYAIVNDNGRLNSSYLTLSCNYYSEGSALDQVLFGRIKFNNGDGATFALALAPSGSGIKEYFHALDPKTDCNKPIPANTDAYVISPNTNAAGTWHNVVGTFEKGTGKLYVDGVLVTVKEFPYKEAKICNYTDFLIGSWYQALIPLKGKVDEVRFYNRALSPKEVKSLAAGF